MISFDNMGDPSTNNQPAAGDTHGLLTNIFKEHFTSAVEKNSPEELTSIEIAAIKFFCNVPYQYDPSKVTITFIESSIIKSGTKWIVGIAKN